MDTPGKRSPNGLLREYEFNGDVASRAQAILTTAGVDAILTRPATATAKDVSLADRVAIANRRNATLFVSIHANAHGNGREWTPARGYEVYIYAPGGKAEVLAQRLVKWATELLLPFDPHFPMRGIKTANFYVLRKTKMPAVLIEHGFMTNEADYALLRSNEFRQACAEHIARAVCEHLGVSYKKTAAKPVLRRGSKGDAVRELQEALKHLGHDPGPIDGIFGPKTEEAVKSFQRAAKIAVDGVVGPVTWGALAKALAARQEAKSDPKPEPKPTPKPAAKDDGKTYRVVIGSFEVRENAEKLVEKAKKDGYQAWILVADK